MVIMRVAKGWLKGQTERRGRRRLRAGSSGRRRRQAGKQAARAGGRRALTMMRPSIRRSFCSYSHIWIFCRLCRNRKIRFCGSGGGGGRRGGARREVSGGGGACAGPGLQARSGVQRWSWGPSCGRLLDDTMHQPPCEPKREHDRSAEAAGAAGGGRGGGGGKHCPPAPRRLPVGALRPLVPCPAVQAAGAPVARRSAADGGRPARRQPAPPRRRSRWVGS